MAWLTVGVMAAAASAAPPDEQARAREIHARLIGVDSHIDTLQRVVNGGEDISKRTPRGHVDLPRLKESGMVAPFFALLRRGYTETDVRKILGANLLRVLREVTGS
jgi:microsomal dipeptidase-like Zn-dependent dipeptidase